MSSCLAITLRSSATPPSGGEGSCAEAIPAVSSTAATGRIVETRRVPTRIRFIIEFLASKAHRGDAAALGQVDKADLNREEVRANGREDMARRQRRPCRARMRAAPDGGAGVPQQSRPERRCDDRAR